MTHIYLLFLVSILVFWLVERRTKVNKERKKKKWIQLTKCVCWGWSWRYFGCQYFIYYAVPCVICVSTVGKSTSIRYHFWTVIQCDRCIDHFGILQCESLDKRDDAPEALFFKKPTQNSRAINPACAAQPYRPVCIGYDRVTCEFDIFHDFLFFIRKVLNSSSLLFFFAKKLILFIKF